MKKMSLTEEEKKELKAINANKARMYFRGKVFEVGPNFSKYI